MRVRVRSSVTVCLAAGFIMATTSTPIVLAFSDAEEKKNSSASSVANDVDSQPLGKAHADSKEDGSDHPPPWIFDHGNGSRWDRDDKPPPDRRNESSGDWNDDEIIPASCSYYERRKRDCSKPRTCRDCLEMDGCMINQFGACVNMSKQGYEPAMDYHKAFEFNLVGLNATNTTQTQRYHFPAADAAYCSATDAACLKCKEIMFAGDVTDSRFCVGENNCLCIATCEASGWEQLAGGLRCGPPPKPKSFSAQSNPPPPATETETTSGVNWRDVWTMGGIPALVVIVGILVIRSNRREAKRREEAARQELENDRDSSSDGDSTAAPTRPGRLNLTGWQSLRNHLIKKENLLLEGADDVSPKHRYVDLLEAQPDAVNPQVTILAAPVMGAVMVEASAPSLSPHGGVEPSAPSFDSEFEFDEEDIDMV